MLPATVHLRAHTGTDVDTHDQYSSEDDVEQVRAPLRTQPYVLKPARYVLLPLAEIITGYSVKAMERKIERADWIEGREWIRAPDNRVMLDVLGYEKWAVKRYR
jgi:hypothetical protein